MSDTEPSKASLIGEMYLSPGPSPLQLLGIPIRAEKNLPPSQREDWIAHRDFTPIEALPDDGLEAPIGDDTPWAPDSPGWQILLMYLYTDLMSREAAGNPVRVTLVGAGKFGSMFLAQVPTSVGLVVTCIADLSPERARAICHDVGWSADQVAQVEFTDDAESAIKRDDVDVVVEATGQPAAGIRHARAAFHHGKHIVMVNVEADALAGSLLAREALSAGIVYTMAYGDQPALICEQVEWARSCGFKVIAAGKGTKYLPAYHTSTPATVWDHYGLTANEAYSAGMNSKMFNSFLDGTKSALEMAVVANACDLCPAQDGLQFPPCSADDLAQVLRPQEEGGVLEFPGQVEVVSSLARDGTIIERDLRWGVYVVLEAPNAYAAACFRQYGMNTDESGRYSAMYKPFHLIGLELNISILSAALLGKPTGMTRGFKGDAVAIAKRALAAGDVLDGEGGATVWGKLLPAERSLAIGCLPIGLANSVVLRNDIAAGQPVTWQDVDFRPDDPAVVARKSMEQLFAVSNPSDGPVPEQ